MSLKKRYLFFILLGVFTSCKKDINIKSRYQALNPFEEVVISDAFEVNLNESTSYSIEITGDEDVIGEVDFSIENQTLTVKNKRKVKWLSPTSNKIKLNLSSLPLKKLTADEGCLIQTINPITSEEFGLILTGKSNEAKLELNNKKFYYWNNFPTGGKVTLSGKTESLSLWNFAIMSVDAKNLVTDIAFVENSSKGDCEVNAGTRLEYKITGEGNIHLYGNPGEIISNGVTSSGQLIQH